MPHQTFATSGKDLLGQTIDNGRLQFISVLGVGAYGVVYLAVDLHAPTPVYLAVKCLLRAGLDSRQRHFQRREIALHQLASRHPNVVTLHKVLEEGDYVFVIMDFCDEGDLFGMITESQRYIGKDALIKKIFLQIVDAVEYLHSMGIFHRDLKPENILCSKDGEKICIADFGLATSERSSSDFGCGSTFYLSPECQGGLFERLETYSTESNDIWSLGVILVNLTCGRNPWKQACPADDTFRAYVHNPAFLRTILPISNSTNAILQGLFALDPAARTPLRVLREQILAVETFSMTELELRSAHAAARAAAASVRPVPAPAPYAEVEPRTAVAHPHHTPAHVHVQTPPHKLQVEIDMDQDTYSQDSMWSKVSQEYIACSASGSGSGYDRHPYARAYEGDWAEEEEYEEDAQFEYATYTVHPAPAAAGAGYGTVPFPKARPYTAPAIVEEDEDEDEDMDQQGPCSLVPPSSRSSSSDEDALLPPTPDFPPADKPHGGMMSTWDMSSKPHFLHLQSISSLSAEC